MEPLFFEESATFRRWLEANHDKARELLVGFYKTNSGRQSLTWPQSVDEALCFGWIDGVRKSIDEISYSIRFTPRRPASTWSAVNIRKIAELTEAGRMHPSGIKAFENRNPAKAGLYSYEKDEESQFSKGYEEQFKNCREAWDFFCRQPPYYRRTATHWVMDARQTTTQLRRLEKLIAFSRASRRIL